MNIMFACGRFNPPTAGHRKMIDEMVAKARQEGMTPRLFATMSHEPERNPLAPAAKLEFLRRLFPEVEVALTRNAFTAAEALAAEGTDGIMFVVGQDRQGLAESLTRYGVSLGLKTAAYHVVERLDGDPSATAAREAAASGDLDAFRRFVPSADETLIGDLFRAVRLGMGAE